MKGKELEKVYWFFLNERISVRKKNAFIKLVKDDIQKCHVHLVLVEVSWVINLPAELNKSKGVLMYKFRTRAAMYIYTDDHNYCIALARDKNLAPRHFSASWVSDRYLVVYKRVPLVEKQEHENSESTDKEDSPKQVVLTIAGLVGPLLPKMN